MTFDPVNEVLSVGGTIETAKRIVAKLWKSRGAEFITEPIPKYGGTRCYIRDPDGYITEVGQSTDVTYG